MENECEGCLTYNNTYDNVKGKPYCELYIIPRLSEVQQCPCLNCLIKCICVNRCKDFVKHMNLSRQTIYPKLKKEVYYDPWRKTGGK